MGTFSESVTVWSGLRQEWRGEGHLFILPFEEHASWRELNICMCIGSEIYDPSSLQECQPWGCQNSIPCVYTQHTDLCLASEWESHRTKKCKHQQPRNPTGTEGYQREGQESRWQEQCAPNPCQDTARLERWVVLAASLFILPTVGPEDQLSQTSPFWGVCLWTHFLPWAPLLSLCLTDLQINSAFYPARRGFRGC